MKFYKLATSFVLIAVLLGVFAPTAFAAISFDAETVYGGGGGTSYNFNHTIGASGTDLFVIIESAGDTSSVTWNGGAMTRLGGITGSNGDNIQMFQLSSPTTGTHAVAVTSSPGGSFAATAISYNGSNGQANFTTHSGTASTSVLMTVPVSGTNSWVLSSCFLVTGDIACTAGTGVTNNRTGGSAIIGAGDSGPTSSNTSHTWTSGGSKNFYQMGVEIKAAASAATPANFGTLTFFGNW